MLTSRGLPASDVLVAPDVADIILANEWILKLLDNRNYQIGGVDPETLPTGATKICRLNIKGHMVDVLSYEDTYTEVDGSVVPFIPKGKIAVGAPAAGRTVYGAITQVEQSDGEFHTYTGVDVPKYLSDAKHNVRELTLSSAPSATSGATSTSLAGRPREVSMEIMAAMSEIICLPDASVVLQLADGV